MLLKRIPHAVFSVASLLLALQLCCSSSNAQETVPFVLMVSTGVNDTVVQKDTSGVVPAVRMALERINDQVDLLPGYRLELSDASPLNSECKRTSSLDTFFDEINAPPKKLFVLGCGCSTATEPVAEISHFWEVIHMSYASLSPALVHGEQFPNFFRTVPNALSLVHIIHAVMDQYGWQRLAVISEEENLFSMVVEALQANFSSANMNLSTLTLDRNKDNVMDAVQNTFFNQSLDYRIYFLNMYHRQARAVLCSAYLYDKERFLTPRYVWITLGWYPPRWWTRDVAGNDSNVPCSDWQLEAMLNRSLVIAQYPNASNATEKTNVAITNAQFFQEYLNRSSQGGYPYTFSAMFAYDAMWAMAFGLRSMDPSLNLSLLDDEANARAIADALNQELMEMEFLGISGRVSFDSSGSRAQTNPRVLQYRFESNPADVSEPVLVGRVGITYINQSADATFVYVEDESNSSVWPVIVPYDGTPIIELRAIHLAVFVVFTTLAVANIIFASVCAVINFIFRHRKVIRLNSPNLNYLIILGTMLLSICVLFYTYPAMDSDVLYGMCIVRAYLQPCGYVLVYGTVCAKMWRIYHIFHNPTTKKKTIRDWQLLLIVMVLLGLAMVYVTLALALDRDYHPVLVTYTEETPSPNEYDIEVQYETLICSSTLSNVWISLLFLLLYLVIVVAVFFAFRTRKVKIKALNDAKEIAAIIYVVFLILTIMLIAAFFLDQYRNTDASVFSFGLLLGMFITLMFIFVPKWRSLYKDPHGENIFERSASKPSFTSGVEVTAIERDRMKAMSQRISELEERLSKYETVTPFAARKRLLTSPSVLECSTDMRTRSLSSAALLKSGVENRTLSFSPTINPTASLPIMLSAPIQKFKFESTSTTSTIIKENLKESPTNTSDSGVNEEALSPNATLERNDSHNVLESSISVLVRSVV